jgi:hypothetical protein
MIKMASEFKDWFTLDGRLTPPAGVTKRKVEAVRELVEKALRGNRIAAGTLQEAITTSDASLNLAYLVNLNVLPQYDEAPRVWNQIAGTRPVSDFRKAVLYSLSGSWEDGVLGDGDPRHIAPVVPEGAPYPYSVMAGEESASAGVQKRGFKTAFTFEAFINDAIGFLRNLPSEMLQVALDTEEYEVFTALISGVGSTQQLDAATNPDGTTVVANAPLSREALIAAKYQVAQREVNGRKIQVTGGWKLVVPVGRGIYADFILNQTLATIQDGSLAFTAPGYNPLSDITVLESEYVTGTNWYLVPVPGATRRPVLERLQLIGHEAPELRVQNLTGSYVGGGAVSPFEGDFDTDSAEFRIRLIGNGTLWTADAIVWSDGSGS